MRKYAIRKIRKIFNNYYLSPVNNLFTPFFSGIGSIVMLHRIVADDKDIVCEDIEVTKDYLEQTIEYFISNDYEIVSLNTAYEILTGKIKMTKKFVVITFDDGYIDNYTLAYPIFKKYNIPFTIYITTGFPDKTALLWWYALKDLINTNKVISFNFNGKNHLYNTAIQKEKVYFDLKELILSFNIDQQECLFKVLFEDNGINVYRYSEELTMNWNQVKELSKDKLVTIGAHTTNHYNLKTLDIETVRKEILNSKLKLELITETKIEHFAFPFGSPSEAGNREISVAKDLNFKTCTTTRCGNIFPEHSQHLSSLPRITPNPYCTSSFPHYYTSGFIPALRHKFKRVITE